jgi:hypothetical protein
MPENVTLFRNRILEDAVKSVRLLGWPFFKMTDAFIRRRKFEQSTQEECQLIREAEIRVMQVQGKKCHHQK